MKIKYLLILLFILLYLGCGTKQTRPVFGKVTSIKGSVEVYNPFKAAWLTHSKLTGVFVGDSIRSCGNSELEIRFKDDNSIKLAESTTVYIQEMSDSLIIVSNACGEMASELKSIKKKGAEYIVQTPTARAVAKGTHFLVLVTPVTYVTHVSVLDGHVSVYNPALAIEPVIIEPGFYTVIALRIAPLVPVPMNYGQFKKMHRILGPRMYGHYCVKFKIKPNKMKHSAFIVPHRRPGRFLAKRPRVFKRNAGLGPDKKVKAKGKAKPGPGTGFIVKGNKTPDRTFKKKRAKGKKPGIRRKK